MSGIVEDLDPTFRYINFKPHNPRGAYLWHWTSLGWFFNRSFVEYQNQTVFSRAASTPPWCSYLLNSRTFLRRTSPTNNENISSTLLYNYTSCPKSVIIVLVSAQSTQCHYTRSSKSLLMCHMTIRLKWFSGETALSKLSSVYSGVVSPCNSCFHTCCSKHIQNEFGQSCGTAVRSTLVCSVQKSGNLRHGWD